MACLPGRRRNLKSRGSGRVINLGSTLSVISLADRTPYASSKGAVLQLNAHAGARMGPLGHYCQLHHAGPVHDRDESIVDQRPCALGRNDPPRATGPVGKIEVLGGLVVFLASDASSFITGAGIAIDGGWTGISRKSQNHWLRNSSRAN